jgi:nucleotide-binding universal stress UspA family protein
MLIEMSLEVSRANYRGSLAARTDRQSCGCLLGHVDFLRQLLRKIPHEIAILGRSGEAMKAGATRPFHAIGGGYPIPMGESPTHGSATGMLEGNRLKSIFHPSDFSEASEVAFAHALKLALAAGAELSMLHAAGGSDAEWEDFPGVREILERWKLIPEGSPRSAVAKLGIEVRKVLVSSNEPVTACLGYLERHPADLIVLAVHRGESRMGWLGKSVGKPMARRAGEVTLFIPHGVKGFVSRADGSVALRNILIPVTKKPLAQPAIEAVVRLIASLGLSHGTVTLLHAGPESDMPELELPEHTGWNWQCWARSGDAEQTILRIAAALSADLIVMTTDGPDGFLDGLRGTTSERVLSKAHCPVACLPVGSFLG